MGLLTFLHFLGNIWLKMAERHLYMKRSVTLALVAAISLIVTPSYAYLDPGASSAILQILAALALVIGIGWRFIFSFVKKIFGIKTKKDKLAESKIDIDNDISEDSKVEDAIDKESEDE